MSNIFQKLGIAVEKFGTWVIDAIKDTAELAIKVETILKAEKPLEASFISGLSTIVADVEALIAASDTVMSAEGLNVSADTTAYQKFLTLIDDFRNLAPIVEEAVDILEGNETATVSATTATTVTTAS